MSNEKQMSVEEMSNRQLFAQLKNLRDEIGTATKNLNAVKDAYGKARNGLAEWARPERLDLVAERYLLAEKDQITDCIAIIEDLQNRFNEIGGEIDCRRMELDAEKIKQGLS
jgi:hypothetical protein